MATVGQEEADCIQSQPAKTGEQLLELTVPRSLSKHFGAIQEESGSYLMVRDGQSQSSVQAYPLTLLLRVHA